MPRATVMLLFALFALASCNGAGIEMSPSREISTGSPAGDIDPLISPIKTLAIRPAYTKLVIAYRDTALADAREGSQGLGKTVQLTAHVWLTEGGEEVGEEVEFPLEWTTENFGIASVDENGLVTAVSSGDTFIHVQIDGKEAIARVIVESVSSMDPNIDIAPAPP